MYSLYAGRLLVFVIVVTFGYTARLLMTYTSYATHHVTSHVTLAVSSRCHVVVEPDVSMVTNNTVLVFVQSAPLNTQKRSVIRQTWANLSNYQLQDGARYDFTVIFTMGKDYIGKPNKWVDIEHEMTSYRDILLLDMRDEYNQLIHKGYYTMSWILDRLPHVKHVMKTDDDVIHNMYIWLDIVNTLDQMSASCYITCFVWIHSAVLRTHPQYSVSYQEYKHDHYPSFCSGMGYIMTTTAMAAILEASQFIPLFIRDDPYFTGMTAYAAGVPLITVPWSAFVVYGDNEMPASRIMSELVLAAHNMSMPNWLLLWESILMYHHHSDTQRQLVLTSVASSDRILPELQSFFQLSYHSKLKDMCSSSLPKPGATVIVPV